MKDMLSKENLEKVVRSYDVRGIVERDINEVLFFAIGKAIAEILSPKKIFLGHDHRKGGKTFAEALALALNSCGITPAYLGMVTTPVVQFYAYRKKASGIMITASHNPKEYNGAKFFIENWEGFRDEMKEYILENAEKIKKEFKEFAKKKAEVEEIAPEEYKEFLLKSFSFEKEFTAVVDCSNGPAAKFAPEILSELGVKVFPIACEISQDFPAHEPDPCKEKNTVLCREYVRKRKADFGICFDGDGDRVIVISENAEHIPGDFGLGVLSLSYEKPKVVTEVKVSKGVVEFIENSLGGEVILERVGNVFVKKTLKERDLDLGGEYSGHYMFKEYPLDDGLYSALKFISVVDSSSEPLGKIVSRIPRYVSSPEYRIEVGEDKKWEIVEKAKNYFSNCGKIIDIDGIRVELDDAWFLIRASNTEPKISVRIEGRTQSTFEKTKQIVFGFLKLFGVEVKE